MFSSYCLPWHFVFHTIRLPFVEATIAEVQRCGNIVPGSVRHKATRNSNIGSKTIVCISF